MENRPNEGRVRNGQGCFVKKNICIDANHTKGEEKKKKERNRRKGSKGR